MHTSGEPIFTYVDLEVYRRRLEAEPDRLSMLIALLLLGDDVRADDLAELLVETGIAELRDGALRGLVRVVPHDDLLIASDRLDVEGADRVAGVHRPSATLAHLTVRAPVERALDLCTGNGIQALLLSRHAGHVVRREDLMATVWDVNWFGSTKTLDVHVSGLRKKLGDDPAEPTYLHTVRGVGFRFSGPEEVT